jgi:hypothetical protein
MFAEIRLACIFGIPVVYCGQRKVLSAYRNGVKRFEKLQDGMAYVVGLGRPGFEQCEDSWGKLP